MSDNKTELQLNAIQEYMDAVSDYHEATLLVSEMRVRLVESIQANRRAGLKNPDPLSAIIGLASTEQESVVERVTRKVPATPTRSSNGTGEVRTRNSPRNSPGHTKKAVYDALPGDASALAARTGLPKTKIWSAAADLVNAGLVEKHGTQGNTTYTVKGERRDMDVSEFAKIHYHTLVADTD